ncbi:MAG: helix-hairpin-helix domain-containing protein [Deltaproteobacteria bacterium]|nr:helix-hairpin-helix domain-containing protein [Deltaproteobacteria bacterium]MBZ0219998.1 helix-hairpin-helix domain-containing protein [Deltaproteobacteria bacterium]
MRDKRYPAFLLISIALLVLFIYRNPSLFSEKPSASLPYKPLSTAPTSPSPAPLAKAAPEDPRPSIPVFPLDINKASAEDLMLLPGIGEKTALRIVEKRAEMNGFRTVDDLTEVKWVGKVKLERIRGLIFAGPSNKTPGPTPESLP